MIILLLTSLLGCATAQYTTMCECGLFNEHQFNTSLTGMPLPLSYIGHDDQVDIGECDKPAGQINDCMLWCQLYYDEGEGNDVALCDIVDNNQRCLGSKWCEYLHNNGISNIQNGVVSLYYRMVECEGTVHADWTYGYREISDKGLCCTNGEFSHCDTACETCTELNLCECGIFAGIQFDADRLQGRNPIPLHNIGGEWGPPTTYFCENWPEIDFQHPCDSFCRLTAGLYKANITLQSPHNLNPGVSFGQFYCQAMKSRWGVDWPAGGIGPTQLRAHARMAGCPIPGDETGTKHLRWLSTRTYTCMHQELCCDGDGNRFPCPVIRSLDGVEVEDPINLIN